MCPPPAEALLTPVSPAGCIGTSDPAYVPLPDCVPHVHTTPSGRTRIDRSSPPSAKATVNCPETWYTPVVIALVVQPVFQARAFSV
jgi:hypothetical protein